MGSSWAGPDLAQDPPVLQLGVSPLTRAPLAGVRGVDVFLATGERAVAAAVGIQPAPPLRDSHRLAAALVSGVGHREDASGVEGVDDAVFARSAHVLACSG